MRAHRLLAAALAAAVVGLTACSGPPPARSVAASAATALKTSSNWTWQKQAVPFELGVTHTQDSLDVDEPADARQRGMAILSDHGAIWQNVHLMGFGTLNPEPTAGAYDWTSLDARMQLVKDTGGTTVLTLCCSPDWMKGGAAGQTDWSKLEDAPLPEHFDDYAALAAAAVQRYPQIQRVLVWNELKGFYNTPDNRWDYEGYTALYNKTYAAVKAVRPDVLVGGPYAVLTSLDPDQPDTSGEVSGPWGAADQRSLDIVSYWLANNVGADFVAVDGGSATRQGTDPTSIRAGAQKFADLTAWIRGKTKLPVWWAEFYPDLPGAVDGSAAGPESAAATLAMIAADAQAGVAGALLWSPQADKTITYSALWTDSRDAGGGQPTPLTAAWQWLVPRLAKGDVEIGYSSTMPLLAFREGADALVVNLTGDPVAVAEGTDPIPAWASTTTDTDSD